jgi:hypothetical protein
MEKIPQSPIQRPAAQGCVREGAEEEMGGIFEPPQSPLIGFLANEFVQAVKADTVRILRGDTFFEETLMDQTKIAKNFSDKFMLLVL